MKIIEKLKSMVEEEIVKAKVVYIMNKDTLASTTFKLTKDVDYLKIDSKEEFYTLGTPTRVENGIPVYYVLKGCPYSLDFELIKEREIIEDFKELEDQKVKQKVRFIEEGYTPSDLYSRVESPYIKKIFGGALLNREYFIILLLAVLLAFMLGALIFGNSPLTVVNSTNSTSQAISNLRSVF